MGEIVAGQIEDKIYTCMVTLFQYIHVNSKRKEVHGEYLMLLNQRVLLQFCNFCVILEKMHLDFWTMLQYCFQILSIIWLSAVAILLVATSKKNNQIVDHKCYTLFHFEHLNLNRYSNVIDKKCFDISRLISKLYEYHLKIITYR